MQKLKLRFLVQRRIGHIAETEIKCDLITLYICVITLTELIF
jgi:hypothetical protein